MNLNLDTVEREVAVFWDYENVPLPSGCSPSEAGNKIHNAVCKYGRIVERRVYFEYQKLTGANKLLHSSRMDLSGFDLVNTPTRNKKESLDKKIIADILTFAWDSSQRNSKWKPCIVLITSDGDYSYTLSKLRDRGVTSVVIFGSDESVSKVLVDIADVSLNLEKDVLLCLSKTHPPTHEGTAGKTYLEKTTFYKNRILDAIVSLGDREGLSIRNIKMHLQSAYPTDKGWLNSAFFVYALNYGVAKGEILRGEAGFYKVSTAVVKNIVAPKTKSKKDTLKKKYFKRNVLSKQEISEKKLPEKNLFKMANTLHHERIAEKTTLYKSRIIGAIVNLCDRKGSSDKNIKEHLWSAYPTDKNWENRTFINALKSGVAKGELLKDKNGFYKVSAAVLKNAVAHPKKVEKAPLKNLTYEKGFMC